MNTCQVSHIFRMLKLKTWMDIPNISAKSGEPPQPTRTAHAGGFARSQARCSPLQHPPGPHALPITPHGITQALGASRELDLQISRMAYAKENPYHAQMTHSGPKQRCFVQRPGLSIFYLLARLHVCAKLWTALGSLLAGEGKDGVFPGEIAAAGQNGTRASTPRCPRGGDAAGC